MSRAYKVIYRANLRLEEATEKVREMAAEWPRLQILADFLAAPSRNGIVRQTLTGSAVLLVEAPVVLPVSACCHLKTGGWGCFVAPDLPD